TASPPPVWRSSGSPATSPNNITRFIPSPMFFSFELSKCSRLDLRLRRPSSRRLCRSGRRDRLTERAGERRLLEDRLARALATLPEVLAAEREVRPALLNDAEQHRVVDEIGGAVDAGAPPDVELGLLERRRALVLDDLDARARADRLLSRLERADPAD